MRFKNMCVTGQMSLKTAARFFHRRDIHEPHLKIEIAALQPLRGRPVEMAE
jgi:hypothetical protein